MPAARVLPAGSLAVTGIDTGAYVASETLRPVIGFREWVIVGDELLSPLAHTPWHGGLMRAECLPSCRAAGGLWRDATPHDGPAPDPACVCGLYALFAPSRRRARDRLALVRGAVALSGRIEVNRRGMRAELARIVALALPASSRGPHTAVVPVADRLGVEAVPLRDLGAVASAHGEPLPPSLIPESDPARAGALRRLPRGRAWREAFGRSATRGSHPAMTGRRGT